MTTSYLVECEKCGHVREFDFLDVAEAVAYEHSNHPADGPKAHAARVLQPGERVFDYN